MHIYEIIFAKLQLLSVWNPHSMKNSSVFQNLNEVI